MPQYQPPFQLSITIMHLLVEVGELMGRWAAQAEQTSPTLHKENRIRTIQASLAIEHNKPDSRPGFSSDGREASIGASQRYPGSA